MTRTFGELKALVLRPAENKGTTDVSTLRCGLSQNKVGPPLRSHLRTSAWSQPSPRRQCRPGIPQLAPDKLRVSLTLRPPPLRPNYALCRRKRRRRIGGTSVVGGRCIPFGYPPVVPFLGNPQNGGFSFLFSLETAKNNNYPKRKTLPCAFKPGSPGEINHPGA